MHRVAGRISLQRVPGNLHQVGDRLLGLLLTLLFPAFVFVLGARMLPFLLMPVVMLLPGFICRGQGSAPGESDSDDESGGWGNGPREPQSSPDAPSGGLPLPDAEPARVRLRDHDSGRHERILIRERRPAREPERLPIRRSGLEPWRPN